MARQEDDRIEQAAKRLAAIDPNRDGVTFTIDGPTGDIPDIPRLHKVPGRVNKDGLAIIRRAVCRYLANLASIEYETDELTGRTIAAICRAWLVAQADAQSGKGGT